MYQSPSHDNPSGIPTKDFVRNGRLYYLLDMTRKDEVGVDTKPHTETVTRPSDTSNMEEILQGLEAELEVTTEEGYTGVLRLDHTSVQVTTDAMPPRPSLSPPPAVIPNLSEADLSLIPKSIEEKGKTLTLADVQWSSSEQTDGAGAQSPVTPPQQLHRYQQLPICYRLHGHRQLHRRGGQDRLQRSDLYRHLRQHGGPGGVH